ncbi:hypothetical protein CcaverHIS002_0200690 [Cutaneotrichosporon cavernicola]|uniref:Uncharacterized protein n=1 Tax=Cutaneotrichosporon cavernicola TaxID=279322 RepID=A0AA48I9K6_9TREE|nr:uncharacterized protein CcaverHIS019_0200740 [Cutaneotrichosporon cavernicola]BEI80909.1 hypothetical protein CcaverHIS002_0200690 [Cutaneotrichosporon cavernicola]BEI88712.1 hypothetical protein CcaverHIS019_0200740 [Cutaneotrichosporon cavernicola]BEI96486.1 hypothetical protein CcaverHIS631_0200750 [Cutaneotrichosporon cavernicola]BEJ04257.1 hypothetical protein CcaverHIS641_0200740 [Cutaneotrichosporon cavernicola]
MRLLSILSLFAIGALAHEGHDHSNSTSNSTANSTASGSMSAAVPLSSAPAPTQPSGAERLAAGGVAALVVAAVGMAL